MKFSRLIKSAALLLAFIFMVPQAAFAAGAPKVVFAQSNTDFAIKSAEIQKTYRNQSGNQPQAVSPQSLRVLGKTADMSFDFKSLGAQTAVVAPDGRFFLQFKESSQVRNCLEKLAANPDIVYAQKDTVLYTNGLQQSAYGERWGVAAIEADIYAQHLASAEGSVTVAVVDSGCAPIPATEGRTVDGYDFMDNDSNAFNDTSVDGHGTFIAGIIADCSVGTGVKIMPVRVLGSKEADLSTALNGIYYAVDNGADVINISLGGILLNCKPLDDALAYAEEKGVVVVVCSGNAKTSTANYCPAHIESAITVSAIDENLEFAEKYSNYGEAVDVCAPGTNIIGYATDGTEKALTGTSMSAAFVSAAAAMYRLQNPTVTPAQVQSVIKDSCKDLGEEGFDIYYGYGIPLLSALISEVPAPDPEPTPDPTPDPVPTPDPEPEPDPVPDPDPEPDPEPDPAPEPDPTPDLDPEIIGITVKKAPAITAYTYKSGEPLSLAGLEIEVLYSDGNKVTVTDTSKVKASGYDSATAGEQKVTVEYEGFTAEYTVTVQYTWWQWIIRILLLGFIWY